MPLESMSDANLSLGPCHVEVRERTADLPLGVRGPLQTGSAPAPHPGPDYETGVSCQADGQPGPSVRCEALSTDAIRAPETSRQPARGEAAQ